MRSSIFFGICLVPLSVACSGAFTSESGDAGVGGQSLSGGQSAMGGEGAMGGASMGGATQTGGMAATGGVANTGGEPGDGGAANTGGAASTGGVVATGGANATGGRANTGGANAMTGGSPASGGHPSTGGHPTTGGMPAATGGSMASGGATAVPCGPNTCAPDQKCCDTSCGACAPLTGLCPAIACAVGGAPGTGGSSNRGGASGTGGTTAVISSDPCGGCATGEICIYQIGGPGPSHYTCATQLPCGAAGACACIQNQGTCTVVPNDSNLKVNCECDNGMQ